MERPHREASLALPFAALGVAGGTLSAHITVGINPAHTHGDGAIGVLMMVLTPLTCAFLGGYLRGRVQRRFLVRTVIATVLAGILNGFAVGLFVGARAGVAIGAVCGSCFSLPFIPATVTAVVFGRRVGRARADSVIDAADRRGVWIATCTAIGLGALAAAGLRGGAVTLAFAGLSLAGLGVLVALDVAAAVQLRWMATLTRGMRLRQRTPMELDAGAQALDLGVGDEAWEEVARSPMPYREADRLVRVVHGHPAQARAAMDGVLRRDLIAAVIVGGTLFLQAVIR